MQVEQFHGDQKEQWQRLLKRLRRNGDWISVSANASLAEMLEIDSSVFHLVLEPSPVRSERQR